MAVYGVYGGGLCTCTIPCLAHLHLYLSSHSLAGANHHQLPHLPRILIFIWCARWKCDMFSFLVEFTLFLVSEQISFPHHDLLIRLD